MHFKNIGFIVCVFCHCKMDAKNLSEKKRLGYVVTVISSFGSEVKMWYISERRPWAPAPFWWKRVLIISHMHYKIHTAVFVISILSFSSKNVLKTRYIQDTFTWEAKYYIKLCRQRIYLKLNAFLISLTIPFKHCIFLFFQT